MYMLGLLVAMFLPAMLQPWLHPFRDVGEVSRTFTLIAWFSLATLVCFAVFMWIILRGYFVFAVTDSSLRDALFASLNKLQLPYEESLGVVELPSLGAHLQVSIQAWAATAQIKMKEWRFRGVLSDIVRGMKEHYRTSASPVNPTCCIPYVMIGILGMLFSGWFYFLEFA